MIEDHKYTLIGSFTLLWRVYLYSSVHIALCTLALYMYISELLDTQPSVAFGSLLFFGTLGLYNVHRWATLKLQPALAKNFRYRQYKRFQWIVIPVIILSSFGTLISMLYLSSDIWIKLLFPFLLCLLYVFPIFPGKQRLRDYHYVKLIVIAMVWSMLEVYVPQQTYDVVQTIAICGTIFLFIVGITIPFDIRDMHIDRERGVYTLSLKLGVAKARIMAQCMVLLSFLPLVCIPIGNIHLAIWAVVCLISALIIRQSTNYSKDTLYTFWLDGTMALPWMLHVLCTYVTNG